MQKEIFFFFLFIVIFCHCQKVDLSLRHVEIIPTNISQQPYDLWIPESSIDMLTKRTDVSFVDLTAQGAKKSQDSIFSVAAFPEKPTQQTIVNSLLSQVSKTNLKANLEKFCSHPHRMSRRAGSQESMDWLKAQIDQLVSNLPTNRSSLFSTEWVKINGYLADSLIVTMKGRSSSDEAVILGAHSDDVGHPQAGADDNASGTVAVLEALRLLAESTSFLPQRPVLFMFFTAEESGLIGSAQIARAFKASNRKVYAMLQHDMVGYNRPNSDLEGYVVTEQTNRLLTDFLGKLIVEYGKGIKKVSPYNRMYGSDHISFNNQGYPAACWKEFYFSPQYHSANDKPQYVNFDLIAEFSKVAIAFAVELSLAQ